MIVLVVSAMLGACTGDEGGGTGTSPTATTKETRVADPEQVLQEQATQLRELVDGVMARYPGIEAVGAGDHDDACVLPNDNRWPRRWIYARRTFFDDADPRTTAREIVDRFVADGWSQRVDPAKEGQVRVVVQRDGTSIGVMADVAEGGRTLQLNAASPCVRADGTLDRRPVT